MFKQVIYTVLFTCALNAVPAYAGWQQTFNDDFTSSTLDASKWVTHDFWGQHNLLNTGERQCYVDSAISLNGGILSLTANVGAPTGGCNPDPGNLGYTSGEVTTANSFRQAFGYFEMRAKMPAGKGLWPAFRLSLPGGPFPPQPPEIFILEFLGNSVSAALQRYSYLDVNDNQVDLTNSSTQPDLTTGFHNFGIDWQPNLLIYYIDGVEVYRVASTEVYGQPMYMIVDLAVGGYKAGDPDATTIFPAALQVDYVRAWMRVNDGTPDNKPPGYGDTTPPVVKITKPEDHRKIDDEEKFTMTATATDNVGVTSVVFQANGIQICSFTAAPYTCKAKMPKLPKHTKSVILTAIAKDAAGNSASDSVTVRIDD